MKIKRFIKQIEELFGKKIEEIIFTHENQIKEMILSIRDNIRYYNTIADSEVLMKVYNLSKEHCDPYYQLIARGNSGVYRFNMGFMFESTEILNEVIYRSAEDNFKELTVFYSIQLAFVYLTKDKKLSMRALNNIECFINNDLSYDTLFDYYYFYGIILNRLDKPKDAHTYFEKAYQYAMDQDKKARVNTNIGLTYRKQGRTKNALLWNNKALDLTSNKEIRAAIFNNIANIYIHKGEPDRGRWFLDQAMKCFHKDFDVNVKVIVYDTYIQIDPINGLKLLDELLNLIEELHNFTYSTDLVECLRKCLNQLKLNKDIESIKNLSIRLLERCEKEGDTRIFHEIRSVVVEILISFKQEGVMEYEKIFESINFNTTSQPDQ